MCVSIIVAVQETSQVLTNGIANTPTGYSLICLNSVSLALQQVVALPYRKTGQGQEQDYTAPYSIYHGG